MCDKRIFLFYAACDACEHERGDSADSASEEADEGKGESAGGDREGDRCAVEDVERADDRFGGVLQKMQLPAEVRQFSEGCGGRGGKTGEFREIEWKWLFWVFNE